MNIKLTLCDVNGSQKNTLIRESQVTIKNFVDAIKKYPIVGITVNYENVHGESEEHDYLYYAFGNIGLYLAHKNDKLNAIYNAAIKFIKQNCNSLIMTDVMKKYWATKQRRQYIYNECKDKLTINEAKVLIPQFCMDFPSQYSNLCNNISILTSLMASWNSNGTLDYDSLVDSNYSNCTICGMFIVGENLCTLLYPRLASVNNSTDVATFYGDYKKICDDYMKQYPKPNYQ